MRVPYNVLHVAGVMAMGDCIVFARIGLYSGGILQGDQTEQLAS